MYDLSSIFFQQNYSIVEKPIITGSRDDGRSPGSRSLPGEREIIELQDVRMSPIAPIRRRPGTTTPHDPARFPPSFRMARGPAATAYHSTRSAHGLRYRGKCKYPFFLIYLK